MFLHMGSYRLQRAPGHHGFVDCKPGFAILSRTSGQVAGSLVDDFYGGLRDRQRRATVELMVDRFLEAYPEATVTISNDTPRGRKRRGLKRARGPMLCVKLGSHRRYFPGVTIRLRDPIIVTRQRVSMRCRCKRVNRAQAPVYTTLWPRTT